MRFFSGKKSLAVTLLLAITATNFTQRQQVKAEFNSVNGRPFEFNAGGFELVQQPGMGLRIQQHTIDSFKNSMQDFFPNYFEHDMNLPSEYHYQINFLWDYATWNIDWSDIHYDKPEFDIKDIKFRMTNAYDKPEIIVDFPALEKFNMHAKQATDAWWIPDGDTISVDFEDFDIDFSCSLHINEDGNLRPVFYTFHMKFGDSYVYHDNFYLKFIMHQILQFGMIMVENTAYFCGELILSQIGEPVLTSFFNNYKLNLRNMPSPFLGQTMAGTSDFIFDWRQTNDPVITDGQMDLRMIGDISYAYGQYQACFMNPDPFDFMDHTISSQWVMTESAATCLANGFANSGIGNLQLNEKKTNELFNVTDIKTDTTSLAAHLPLFQQKIGPNKPLKTVVTANHIKVTYGQFDCDIILDYTLGFQIMSDDTKSKELMYDEVKFVTSLDLSTDNDDVAQIKILEHKVNVDNKFAGKTLPIRNTMKMTKNEYREFISTLGFSSKYFRDWINSAVFKDGVALPYRLDEFKTDIKFQDKSMHMFFEIEENFAETLEDEKAWFWF